MSKFNLAYNGDGDEQNIPPLLEGINPMYWEQLRIGRFHQVPNDVFRVWRANVDRVEAQAEAELKEKQRQFIADQKAKRTGGQS